MSPYSLKMRASKREDGIEKHISGAEKIVSKNCLSAYSEALLNRALYHSKGNADSVNIKVEKVDQDDILYLEALPVSTINVANYQQGIQKIVDILKKMGIDNRTEFLERIKETYQMRGAMLLDVDTLERLEPDQDRGVRATYMDEENPSVLENKEEKNHFREAIVLATKVANAPNIIGEICISDDPDYVTGYVASKEIGYVRITKLKEMGSHEGGRIFLYRGEHSKVQDCVEYLAMQKVIVRNVPSLLKQKKLDNKWFFIENTLEELKENHLYRSMTGLQSAQSTHVDYHGKDILMLASNSYLDMSNDIQVKAYTQKVMEEYGVGSGGSRLTTGTTAIHNQLEDLLAKMKGTEAALVYNTGYMANVGIISALCSKEDIIFSDELNHASIIDGCRLSKAKIIVYRHNDMVDLESKIIANPCAKGLIVSDAVFSMDGDIVDLPRLVELAEQYGLFSMIDEAHATGVIGESGLGTVEYYHMDEKPDIIMGTLSKAIGSEGGFVCGKQILIDYLSNKSRSFIFSTSLSPAVMASSIKAIELIMSEPQRVGHLQENVQYFCRCLRDVGIEADSKTAIIPIIIGDDQKAMQISKDLFELGYYISAIRYPTVKKGKALLRVALMATHTKEELKRTAKTIAFIIDKYKEVPMNYLQEYKEKVLNGEFLSKAEAMILADAPLKELCTAANKIREHFCGNNFDICTIINGKSGKCSEDCKYCAQSVFYSTETENYPLLDTKEILEQAKYNDDRGVLRYSIVTSGKNLNDDEVDKACESIKAIRKETGIAVCVSFGLLNESQFRKIKEAGATRSHNNLETSRNNFPNVCTTHSYDDKIETINSAQCAGLNVCSGGIVGLGETMEDRIDMVITIRELGIRSIPVNMLNPIAGTPYENNKELTNEDMCRIVAIFRFLVPNASIRLAGGRGLLPDKGVRCFQSGANAAISGDMLTTSGISIEQDMQMLEELGYKTVLWNE